MSAKIYILKTLNDISKLPIDRRDACLDELKLLFAFNDIAFGDAEQPDISEINWIDDGDKSVSLCQPDGTPILSLKVSEN